MSNIKKWKMLEETAEKAINDGWPSRDDLPTGDPHGDICEKNTKSITPIKDGVFDPYTEGYKQWKKDQEAYENTMKNKLIMRKGKNFDPKDWIGQPTIDELKCNCGTEKTYGKVPVSSHSHYCDLVTKGQK